MSDSGQQARCFESGVGTADITPPIGTPMAGNFRDDYNARGVHTPLAARCLVVRQGGSAVALLVADLLTVPDALVRRVRERLQSQCGLQPEQVLVAATHTHSGPAVEALAGPDLSAALIERLVPALSAACEQACRACRPSRLWSAATTSTALCYNRRLRLRDGRTVMNWTRPAVEAVAGELGPIDPRIGVLFAGGELLRPDAVLANAALHPAVLAGDNWWFNADWPGYYAAAVRQVFGPDTVGLFLQGAEGNINHIDYADPLQGRGFKEAQRIGQAVGLAVAAARREARPVAGPLAWSSRVVSLPPRRIGAAQLAAARRVVEHSRQSGRPPGGQVDGIPEVLFAADQIVLAERTEPYSAEIQVFRIGDVAVVGLPGEFFVEYGLELQRLSPARLTLVAGLANGSLGYVPTPAAFEEGGYEPTSWRYSRLAPEAGALCVASAREQLFALFPTP